MSEADGRSAGIPFRVVLLGLLYLVIGVNLCLPVLFTLADSHRRYGFLGDFAGTLMLLPSLLYLLAGVGFFLRARWAMGLALFLGLVTLVIAAVGSTIHVVDLVGRLDHPWNSVPIGAVVVAVDELVLILILWLLHLVLVLSDATRRWFHAV